MFAFTELVSDNAPISMSAMLLLDTMKYDMCSITFKHPDGRVIEMWDNDEFIIEFCDYLKSESWSPVGIRKMIDEDESSALQTDYLIEYRHELIKLYDKAKEIKLL